MPLSTEMSTSFSMSTAAISSLMMRSSPLVLTSIAGMKRSSLMKGMNRLVMSPARDCISRRMSANSLKGLRLTSAMNRLLRPGTCSQVTRDRKLRGCFRLSGLLFPAPFGFKHDRLAEESGCAEMAWNTRQGRR